MVEVSRMFPQLHETGKHACGKEKGLWWPWPPEGFVSQILSLNQEGLDVWSLGRTLQDRQGAAKIGGSVPGRHLGGWC